VFTGEAPGAGQQPVDLPGPGLDAETDIDYTPGQGDFSTSRRVSSGRIDTETEAGPGVARTQVIQRQDTEVETERGDNSFDALAPEVGIDEALGSSSDRVSGSQSPSVSFSAGSPGDVSDLPAVGDELSFNREQPVLDPFDFEGGFQPELEDEVELELEQELEQELELETELERETELETETELESEFETETEFENEFDFEVELESEPPRLRDEDNPDAEPVDVLANAETFDSEIMSANEVLSSQRDQFRL